MPRTRVSTEKPKKTTGEENTASVVAPISGASVLALRQRGEKELTTSDEKGCDHEHIGRVREDPGQPKNRLVMLMLRAQFPHRG